MATDREILEDFIQQKNYRKQHKLQGPKKHSPHKSVIFRIRIGFMAKWHTQGVCFRQLRYILEAFEVL